MISWPGSPRTRIRPIGPGAPMRRLGSPRSILARGASVRSGRWPSRVWMTSMPSFRAAASKASQGATAACRRETSLPSVSPKPPGSRKSRCMSMISTAVLWVVTAIGCGSASMRVTAMFHCYTSICFTGISYRGKSRLGVQRGMVEPERLVLHVEAELLADGPHGAVLVQDHRVHARHTVGAGELEEAPVELLAEPLALVVVAHQRRHLRRPRA